MYREFSDLSPDSAIAPRPTVCIVTSELVGLFKNGGIGTAMTGLAQTLAAAGFSVVVLSTGSVWYPNTARDEWRERYKRLGIDLRWLTIKDMSRISGSLKDCGFGVPYLVYDYLRQNRFDIIHFNDCMGEGFYCVTMKRLGAAFQDTLLWVAHHGPSQWVFELNRYLPDSVMLSACNYAERLSTRCTDILWSPSRYLLDWSKSKDFVHPPATYVQQYVIPTAAMFDGGLREPMRDAPEVGAPPVEIVFFGRIEERKGIRLFCGALELLNDTLVERNIKVTLLGKPGFVGMTGVMTYLQQRARGWKFSWQAITDYGQQEAIDYVRSRPVVAVMSSPADNSPCTVYEALTFQIPFIAARTGGIPELIAPEDQDAVLFDYTPAALAAKLEQILRDGVRRARPALSQAESGRRWIAAHHQWRELLPAADPATGAPRRLCVIIDPLAGDGLEETLGSLAGIPQIDRIVIINRSTGPLPQSALRVIDLAIEDPNALLESLHEDAGEAVLLLRAGAQLRPGAICGLLEALRHAEPDGLVPAALDGDGTERIVVPSLGAGPAFSFYEGVILAGGMLVKAEKLYRIARNQPLVATMEFLGLADFAVTGGLDLWPYAEPVLWYPRGFEAAPPSPGVPERVAAYDKIPAIERYYIAAMAYAQIMRRDTPLGHRRALIIRLSRLGLGGPIRLLLRYVPLPVINAVYGWLKRPVWKFLKAGR